MVDWSNDYPDLDDPYRTCEVDGIRYHEEYGESCDECDIWMCENCWPDHEAETGHTKLATRPTREDTPHEN